MENTGVPVRPSDPSAMPYSPQTPAPSFLLLYLGRGAPLFYQSLLPPAGGSVHSIIRRMRESWGPRLANPFAKTRRQGCATERHPRVPTCCARQWMRRAGRGRVWSRRNLGCPRNCGSHTLNVQPTLQGPSPGQGRRGCAFTPPQAPHWHLPSSRAPPLSGGLYVDCSLCAGAHKAHTGPNPAHPAGGRR